MIQRLGPAKQAARKFPKVNFSILTAEERQFIKEMGRSFQATQQNSTKILTQVAKEVTGQTAGKVKQKLINFVYKACEGFVENAKRMKFMS